jgi:hypothetical protein
VLPNRKFAALKTALRARFVVRVGSWEHAHMKLTGLENVTLWIKAGSGCSPRDQPFFFRKSITAPSSSGLHSAARSRLRLKSFGSSLCLCAAPFGLFPFLDATLLLLFKALGTRSRWGPMSYDRRREYSRDLVRCMARIRTTGPLAFTHAAMYDNCSSAGFGC